MGGLCGWFAGQMKIQTKYDEHNPMQNICSTMTNHNNDFIVNKSTGLFQLPGWQMPNAKEIIWFWLVLGKFC